MKKLNNKEILKRINKLYSELNLSHADFKKILDKKFPDNKIKLEDIDAAKVGWCLGELEYILKNSK